MKIKLILLLTIFYSNFSLSQEPTLEECYNWLENALNQNVETRKWNLERSFSFDVNQKKTQIIRVYDWNRVRGFEFDFSDIESFKIKINDSYYKMKSIDSKYRKTPRLTIVLNPIGNKSIFKKLDGAQRIAGNRVYGGGGTLMSFETIDVYFDTKPKEGFSNYDSKNIYKIKEQFEKVLNRILELTSKKNKKTINEDWFKN